jgi:hypothetical protein
VLSLVSVPRHSPVPSHSRVPSLSPPLPPYSHTPSDSAVLPCSAPPHLSSGRGTWHHISRRVSSHLHPRLSGRDHLSRLHFGVCTQVVVCPHLHTHTATLDLTVIHHPSVHRQSYGSGLPLLRLRLAPMAISLTSRFDVLAYHRHHRRPPFHPPSVH